MVAQVRPLLVGFGFVGAILVGGLLMRNVSPSHQDLVVMVLLYAYWSIAWNIIGGMAGQISFGHAVFIGCGAYTSSILFVHFGVNPWIGMFVGGALAGLLGLFVGYLSFRYGLRGVYFSLTTLAFGQVVYLLVGNTDYHGIFGGQGGVNFPVEEPSMLIYQFPDKVGYYYVISILVALSLLLTLWMRRSKVGYYLIAIRENERSAEAAGINITWYKVLASVISAALSGIGGTFYAQYYLFIDPHSVLQVNLSIAVLLPAIVGGMNTVFGPLLGAVILIPISEQIRTVLSGGLGGVHLVVYGLVIILVMRLIPQGLLGWILERQWVAERLANKSGPEQAKES